MKEINQPCISSNVYKIEFLLTLSLSLSASVVDKATLLECVEKFKNAFSTANNFLRPLFDLFLPDR